SDSITSVKIYKLCKMPIGSIIYNDSYEIEWINLYMKDLSEEENVIGKSLDIISKNIITKIKSEESEEDVENNKHEQKFMLKIAESEYVVYFDQQRQLLYFFDKTKE